MSEHCCSIAVKTETGVKSIYCESGGEPRFIADTLMKHYNTRDKAEALVDLGDLVAVDKNLDDCFFCTKSSGGDLNENRKSFGAVTHADDLEWEDARSHPEYATLFLFDGDGWRVSIRHAVFIPWERIEDLDLLKDDPELQADRKAAEQAPAKPASGRQSQGVSADM